MVSGLSCLHGWNSSGIYFLFRAASELKWSEFKGQSSRLGLVLLGLTTYCNCEIVFAPYLSAKHTLFSAWALKIYLSNDGGEDV